MAYYPVNAQWFELKAAWGPMFIFSEPTTVQGYYVRDWITLERKTCGIWSDKKDNQWFSMYQLPQS